MHDHSEHLEMHQDHGHENGHDHQHEHHIRPIMIVSGFLGAGKTTFLNYMLSLMKDKNIDVLVREYGKVSIDDKLINIGREHVHVLPTASVHQDAQLVVYDYLHNLFSATGEDPFDMLMMETSGLDLPESVVQMFMIGHMPAHYRLAGCVIIVDGAYGQENFDEYSQAVNQAAYADIVVINKSDLATEEEIEALKARVKGINRAAKIYVCEFGKADVRPSLDLSVYEQIRDVETDETEPKYMDNIQTTVVSESRPMDKAKVNRWINELFETKGFKLLRSKGFLYFDGDEYRYEFQAVRKSFHSYANQKWGEGEEKKSVLVFIGEGINGEELQSGFSACVAE